jgi:hypothetical protein
MGMEIEDGTGQGNAAKVDSNNRLLVRAASFIGEEVEALEGNAFIVHGECHLAASTTGAFVYIENTSATHNYFITRIYIDARSLTDDIIIRQVFEPTRANGTAVVPVNKNRASGATMEGDFYISDGSSDMTLTSGTQYHAFVMSSGIGDSTQRDMKGSNVLGPNTSMGFTWATVDGGNAVNAEIISFSINIYRAVIE